MPILVETGDGANPDANSYISLSDARQLAVSLGVALAADDGTAEGQLAQAATYLEGFADRFQGHPSNGADQPLSWPRKLVTMGNSVLPDDAIPLLLRKAQVQAAALINSGVDLFPVDDGKFQTVDKTDVLQSEWSEKLSTDKGTSYPQVDTYLRPLMNEFRPANRLTRF